VVCIDPGSYRLLEDTLKEHSKGTALMEIIDLKRVTHGKACSRWLGASAWL
jgi:hypothetical protein